MNIFNRIKKIPCILKTMDAYPRASALGIGDAWLAWAARSLYKYHLVPEDPATIWMVDGCAAR